MVEKYLRIILIKLDENTKECAQQTDKLNRSRSYHGAYEQVCNIRSRGGQTGQKTQGGRESR